MDSAHTGHTAWEKLLLGALILTFLIPLGVMEAAAPVPYPLAAVAACILAFALVCVAQLELAFLLILAVTPFSMERVIPGTGSALEIPTEPMIFVALAAWGVRFLARRSTTFAQSGLTRALLLALGAIVVSTAGSAYRINSIKATLNAVWYGLFGIFIINNFADRDRLKTLAWAFLVPGLIISLYSMVSVLTGHYDPNRGFWWSDPFFTEHGSFAAYLSFVFALALALALEMSGGLKLLFALVALAAGSEVILSMMRGAWMGLAALGLFFLIVSGRRLVRFGNLVIVAIGFVGLAGVIVASGAVTKLERHSQTITDPTNVSTLERVNRWVAGYRMFQSDPLTGVGFGAYPDVYLNYRRIPLGTEISGARMGVHNEYLKVLAETGLIGAATAVLALFFVARIAWRVIRKARDPYLRGMAVGMTGGLVSYGIHAFVNNFLAYDKVAIPVWTAIGVLGAIDTLQRQ